MLRNKEFCRFALCFAFAAATAIVIGFKLNMAAGILSATCVITFGAVFFVFTKARYRSIARLSEQIDLVLHNADRVELEGLEEGELSILRGEITKMMLRIREQNEALKNEKTLLADSLADISHQLRTPLTSVNLTLSLLANTADEKDRRALVRETEELLERMDWLITALLKLSRLDAGVVQFRNEPVEVNCLIDAALRPFLISVELHEIGVQINVPGGITIQGDIGWLAEAIQNILKNCLENTRDCGQIAIACADNPLYTELSIRDSGAGFAKEDLPHLFDRFYRGRSAGISGYGIGLALCKTIITRQGGTVTAKNHRQGGALFSIRFPK